MYRARRIKKNGPPAIAVTTPTGSWAGATTIRAIVSATIRKIAPVIALIGNVSALPLTTAGEISLDLCMQLNSRVRWTESIQEMSRRGVSTFLELGNGSVLTSLLKRIDEQLRGLALGSPGDFEKLQSKF